jgi:hypothetical protein
MAAIPPPAEEVYIKGYDPKLTRRLFGYISPYRWPFLAAMILMIIGSAMIVVGPYLVKRIGFTARPAARSAVISAGSSCTVDRHIRPGEYHGARGAIYHL